MLGLVISILILVVLGFALYPIGRLAKKKGDSPAFWRLLTLISWGFVWIAIRAALRIWSLYILDDRDLFQLIWFGGGICMLIYGLYWFILSRKANEPSCWDQKLSEIGKKNHKE